MTKHNGARHLIAQGPAAYDKAAMPAETPTRAIKPAVVDAETLELVKLALGTGATPEAIGATYGASAGDIARVLAPTHKPASQAPQAAPQAFDPMAEIARLKAENAALKAKAPTERGLTFKVSEKGAVSVYGMGRFPVTLYREQWERLLAKGEDIRGFIAANAARLKSKGE